MDIENIENNIDLNKVKSLHFETIMWYRILVVFTKKKWVDRYDLIHIVDRNVSTSIQYLKQLGFKFDSRKILKKVKDKNINITQYTLSDTPPRFKNTKI